MKKIFNAFETIHQLCPKAIYVACLYAIVSGLLPFFSIYLSSFIVNVLEDSNYSTLIILKIISILLLNAILYIISKQLNNYFYKYNVEIHNNEQEKIINHLLELDFEQLSGGNLNQQLLKYTDCIERFDSAYSRFLWLISELVNGLTTLLVSCIFIFGIFETNIAFPRNIIETHWFEVIIFVIIMLFLFIVFFLSRKLSEKWNKFSENNLKVKKNLIYLMDLLTEYQIGKEIRVFQSSNFIEKFATNNIIRKGFILQDKITNDSAKSSAFIAIIGGIIGFSVYILIGLKGLMGLFSIGNLVLYTGSFMKAVNAFVKIVNSAGKVKYIINITSAYVDIMSNTNEKYFGKATLEYPIESIEFINVCYKYPNSYEYNLKNINFTIKCNEKIALVGKNGSGKTTLVKLLCRLYDVSSGEIRINGINIKEYSKQSIYDLFSIVFQDFTLFSLSLKDNIIGNSDYNISKFQRVVDTSDLSNLRNNMKNQEDTFLYKNLDEAGVDVSGGESQKIAFGRALYKNAPIVILDEPTSSMDPISEVTLYDNFNKMIHGKIAIYISHRLASCIFCDKVIVLKNGQIEEIGTHNDLINNGNGEYKTMWEAQAMFYKS